MPEPYHYLDQPSRDPEPCPKGCKGCEYCSDAYGVDACKDANAEMGLDPYNRAGYYEARRRGWLRRR
jgi:hypothetical protein